jgi:hypothetical protein
MSNPSRDPALSAAIGLALKEQKRLSDLQSALKDPVRYNRDLMGRNIKPTRPGIPWLDLEPESWSGTINRFLDEPYTGKRKVVLAPRGCGKSYSIAVPRICKRIIEDPDITILLGGENAIEVEKRSLWCQARLMAMDEMGYGPFQSKRWPKLAWTVNRPSGLGGQDTVTVGSPDRPGTSQHQMLQVLDDPVGEWTAKSIARGEDGIKWWQELVNQAMEGTEVWIFDTIYPGRNLITYILREKEKGFPNFVPYGRGEMHRGKGYDILVLRAMDRVGNVNFPFWSKEYLADKLEQTTKENFDCQFMLNMVDVGDLVFESQWFSADEPLPEHPTRVMLLNDTATSVGRVKHTSMSCLLVVAKTPDDHAWVLDGNAGKLGWDKVVDTIVDFIVKWEKEGYPIERIPYENTGPAKALPKSVQDCAIARGLNGQRIRSLFVPIPRDADKTARIQRHRTPVSRGKLHFCKGFPRHIFHIDGDGMPQGIMGRQYIEYTYGADQPWDCIDAAADIWGYYLNGHVIFTPPKAKKKSTLQNPEKPWWHEDNVWDYLLKKYPAQRAREGTGAA